MSHDRLAEAFTWMEFTSVEGVKDKKNVVEEC